MPSKPPTTIPTIALLRVPPLFPEPATVVVVVGVAVVVVELVVVVDVNVVVVNVAVVEVVFVVDVAVVDVDVAVVVVVVVGASLTPLISSTETPFLGAAYRLPLAPATIGPCHFIL